MENENSVFIVQEQPNGIIEAFTSLENAVNGIKRFKELSPLFSNSF